jgi:hypothetical protein
MTYAPVPMNALTAWILEVRPPCSFRIADTRQERRKLFFREAKLLGSISDFPFLYLADPGPILWISNFRSAAMVISGSTATD